MKSSTFSRSPLSTVLFLMLGVLLSVSSSTSLFAAGSEHLQANDIIPQTLAEAHGLYRQWVNQSVVNTKREKLQQIILDNGTVFAVTSRGNIQAMDAETGKTLWNAGVDSKGLIVQGLSASNYYVGFTCGSKLYVFNRFNGQLLADIDLVSIPSGELIMGESRVYVACIDRLVYGYELKPMNDPFEEFGLSIEHLSDREKEQRHNEFINSLKLVKTRKAPLAVRTLGDLKVPMTRGRIFRGDVTLTSEDAIGRERTMKRTETKREYIAWPTSSDIVTICEVDLNSDGSMTDKHKVEVLGEIRSSLGYRPTEYRDEPTAYGTYYAGTTEGFVYAIKEQSGDIIWRFPAEEQVLASPVCLDNDLFVVTAGDGLYCIDAITGGDNESTEAKWWTPGIHSIITCSNNRVYTIGSSGDMVILDRMSGQKISSFPVGDNSIQMVNTDTDRIYLATESGQIQCLREVALETPVIHNPVVESKKKMKDVDMSGDDDEDSEDEDEDSEDEDEDEDEDSEDEDEDSEDEDEDSEDEDEDSEDDEEEEDEEEDE